MTGQAPPNRAADPAGDPPTGRPPRSTWILVVCCVAQFMVILDLSIVNVALPSIQSALNFSSADLQWVVDAYAISFAGFLMLGGRAADELGQRRGVLAALGPVLGDLAGGRRGGQPRDADHRPRRAGLQLRVHGGVFAGDHHLFVSPRAA